MDALLHNLQQVLLQYPRGFHLSTLKAKVRRVGNVELDEGVFHMTLLALMRSPPVAGLIVCLDVGEDMGYVVMPASQTGVRH